MQTKLDQLLASISPDRTITETYNRANDAINTFHAGPSIIDKWDDFAHCMARFLQRLDACILRLSGPVESSYDHYLAWFPTILIQAYGPSGEKTAFECARTGNEQGLYGVLKAVAMRRAEEYSQNEITAKVGDYLAGLSVDQQHEACSEYISKYGYLLPSEITEANALRIRASFRQVLEKHPRMLMQFQGVGR